MHAEAFAYVSEHSDHRKIDVLDLGSRDVNGTCRPLFPNARYLGVDIREGPCVDEVADAATWTSRRRFDVAVCCEVMEHTPAWPQICATAYRHLRRGGQFIVTTAGPTRAPHSAVDGGALQAGEHYENLEGDKLAAVLEELGFTTVDVREVGEDVQATAVK